MKTPAHKVSVCLLLGLGMFGWFCLLSSKFRAKSSLSNAIMETRKQASAQSAGYAEVINSSDLLGLIEALSKSPASREKDIKMHMLLIDLVRDNPAVAFSLRNNIVSAIMRSDLIIGSLTRLARKDPQQALTDLAGLSPEDLAQGGNTIYWNMFRAWADNNSSDATAAALNLIAGSNREAALEGIGDIMRHSNPQSALSWALALPIADSDVLENVVASVAGANPQLAASYLDTLTDISARNNAILAISIGLGIGNNKDPAAAVAWLNQVATGVTYDTALNNLFFYLSRPNRTTQKLPNGRMMQSVSMYQQNLPAAISLLENVTDPAVRESAINTIATNWSTSDPQAAVVWAESLPTSDSVGALNSILSNWSKNDPNAAFAFVQNSSDPSVFLPADPVIAQSLASSNPQAALVFADSLPDGDTKNQALNNVLLTMSQADFTTAWMDAAALPPADNRVGIMTNLIGTLASKTPAQAAELIDQLPAGTAQDKVMAIVAATWIQQDPQTFTVWLASLQFGDVRDTAIAQLVSSVQATKNPTGVLEWVNTVTNPQIKAALLQTLAQAQAANN